MDLPNGRASSPNAMMNVATRRALVRGALRPEWISVAWMAIESAVAIGAGVIAHSLLLVAFGIDSVIELASAAVLIWRLTVELVQGQDFSERAERLGGRIGGALLFALAIYIVLSAAWSLRHREGAEFSTAGLVLAVVTIPVMYILSRRKLAIADALGSRALRADAVESITCAWLAFVVVVGLIAQKLLGAWWVDAVTSLGILYLVIREGREAWSGDHCDANEPA